MQISSSYKSLILSLCIFVPSLRGNIETCKTTKEFYLSLDSVNFFEAFVHCKQGGMELASIENEVESAALDSFLDPYKIGVTYLTLQNSNYDKTGQERQYLATFYERKVIAEQEYVTKFRQRVGGSPNGFWLSGSNLIDSFSFQYYWLSTGARAIYTNWQPSQPDNARGVEHCLQWVYNNTSDIAGWNDYNCNTTLRYVCEYAADENAS